MKKTICYLLITFSLAVFGWRIYHKAVFKQNVSGYLKRAADANTIELANQELTKVIDYLEANKLTNGYTSIVYQTPDEDIGFWYKNLKASQKELATLNSNSALEKTNVLMKLRETLLDTGERTKVTVPSGLAIYPNNKLGAVLMTLACFSFLGVAGIAIAASEANEKKKGIKV